MSMLKTFQAGWELFGSVGDGQDITAEGTILDGATAGYTYDYTDMPINNWDVPDVANGVVIRVECYDVTPNDDFGFKIWGYAKQPSPAELICDVSALVGTGIINDTAGFLHADTFTVNADEHIKATTAYDSGNNRVAKLGFDCAGLDMLAIEFYDITAADEALLASSSGYLKAYIRFY